TQAGAGQNLKAEYYHSFQGNPEKVKGWEVMGPEADQCVKFESGGLRITLPPGHADTRVDTGLVRGWAVRGDFEITVGYELLQTPKPADAGAGGTRFSLTVALEKPGKNMASLSHRVARQG